MHVEAASPRVGTSAVVPSGSMIAGLTQWVGISVVSKHDQVTDASIRISTLSSSAMSSSEANSVPVRLEARDEGFIAQLESTSGTSGYKEQEKHTCKFLRQARQIPVRAQNLRQLLEVCKSGSGCSHKRKKSIFNMTRERGLCTLTATCMQYTFSWL